MNSHDGKFEVLCSDYGEVRMGSPEFGNIEIRGLKRRFEGRLFGRAMAFSPDSPFFAIAELANAGPKRGHVVSRYYRRRRMKWSGWTTSAGLEWDYRHFCSTKSNRSLPNA